MGHGFDIFGEYARADYVKSPLLKYGSYQTVVVKGKSYDVPSEIQYVSLNTADFNSVSGLNVNEYREALAINASLDASLRGAFGLSITNNYSEEHYRSNLSAFCTVQNVIKKWKLTLPYTDPDELRSMLTNQARDDIANLPPATLFDKYGTHFLVELIIGARADYNTCLTKCRETSSIKNKFEICAEASFKKGTGAGNFSIVTEEELATFESNSVRSAKVSGGRSEYGSYIFEQGNYGNWIESIDNIEDLTIADFTANSLLPIWELCEDVTRKSELSSEFDSYASQFELPAMVGASIVGLYTEKTWSPPITPPPGWELINVDLNRGCGGMYIYLCYQNGLEDQESISDITFIVDSQAVPPGYTKIDQDLNETVGGDFIYLCYKKGVTSNPIRRLDVLIGEYAAPDNGFYFAKNYYWGVKQDLNRNAGGNFIWLAFSYSPDDPWQ